MSHRLTLIVASLALSASACGQPDSASQATPGNEPSAPAAADQQAGAPPSPAVTQSPADGADSVNDGFPDLTPPVLAPEAARGEKGARNVLLSWARAIELQEFGQAWEMFADSAPDRPARTAFVQTFDGLSQITVAVPGGTLEGAAGSSYYTAPVAISAQDAQGRPVRIEGDVVLRRVNDVPGATPEQLAWHVYRANLDWTH